MTLTFRFRRPQREWTVVVYAAWLGAAGCDPVKVPHSEGAAISERAEKVADAYCSVYRACDCPDDPDSLHRDPDQCVAEETKRILRAFEQAESEGLTFNESCFELVADNYERLGCLSYGRAVAEFGGLDFEETFGCALYSGAETGGICEPVAGTPWSDCAKDRYCDDENSCRKRIVAPSVGEKCWETGYQHEGCGPVHYCHGGLPGTCQPAAGGGEPCTTGGGTHQVVPTCRADLFCEQPADEVEGICRPLKSVGEACDGNQLSCDGLCASDGAEGNGTCERWPLICWHPGLQPRVE